jgi:hypothetical protein
MADKAKYFIFNVPLSRSGLQTGYPDQGVLGFSLAPQGILWDNK